MDYNARYYSPYLNRFISPDPIIPEPGNPQSLNRYSYVLNRPLQGGDPTGHDGPVPNFDLTPDWVDWVSGLANSAGDSVNKALAVTHRGISHLAGELAATVPTVYGFNPETGQGEWVNHGVEVGELLTDDLPLLDKNSFYEGLYATDNLAAELASQGIDLKTGIVLESTRTLGNLKPLHPPGMNPVTERTLRNLTDEELLQTVLNPADGEFLKVRPGGNELIDGNTRFYEMQQRMLQNPKGTFNLNLKVPVLEVPRAPFPDPLEDLIY